jgi:cytochrome c oxidase subunit 2
VRASLGFLLALVALTATGCGTGGVATKGDAAHGKQLFTAKCAACHTLADAGSKSTVGPNLDAAFGSDKLQGFKEVTIRQVVADQIKFAGDYGPTGPTMPRNLVKGQDVDDVATYVAAVASLSAKPGSPAPSTPPSSGGGGGISAAGKKAFIDNGCGSCHALAAAGTTGTIGPDLDKLKAYAKAANMPLDQFIRESIVKPTAYVEKGYPPVMPATFASLPKPVLDALVSYLAASAKG